MAASKQRAWQKIRGIVRRAEPTLQRSFMHAVVAVRDGINMTAVRKAYSAGRIDEALDAVPWAELGEPIMRTQLARGLLDVYEASGNAASIELPFNNEFSILNERPTNWMRDNAAMLVKVNGETKAGLRATLASAYESGWSAQRVAQVVKTQVGLTEHQSGFVDNMRARLEDKGWTQSTVDDEAAAYTRQLTQMRALMIARTEAQRAAMEGQREAWTQAADQEYFDPTKARRRWIMVERDHPEDDPCVDLNGETAGLDENFPGGYFAPPDPHPNCLPGDMIVRAARVLAATRRRYDGDLVVIRTAGKHRLACTPNHPILTRYGWVPARSVNAGSDVVCIFGSEGDVTSVNVNDEYRPALIKQVADAFRRTRKVPAVKVPVSTPDFHGDGKGSNIAVVWSDRLLRNEIADAPGSEQGEQSNLYLTHICRSLLQRARHFDAFCDWAGLSANCVMGRLAHLPAVFWGSESVARQLRFAGSPGRDSRFEQPKTNAPTRNSETLRQGELGCSGKVMSDKVLSVDVQSFRGHVFNLQTRNSMYISQGVVTHNCTCALELVLGD